MQDSKKINIFYLILFFLWNSWKWFFVKNGKIGIRTVIGSLYVIGMVVIFMLYAYVNGSSIAFLIFTGIFSFFAIIAIVPTLLYFLWGLEEKYSK